MRCTKLTIPVAGVKAVRAEYLGRDAVQIRVDESCVGVVLDESDY